ncbi:MAG: SDR family oxidoreductase [Magnetospirillum sp.]|nr:SDR family oxidoreductase [Magnetospirillum sp.]
MSDSIPLSIPRAALVTGAGRRIGRALALELGRLGFAVAVHYSASRDAAETVAAEIQDAGGLAETVRADLAREDETAGLIAAAEAAVGPLGVLVNNASTFERDEALTATRAGWDLHMEVNLRAPFVLTQDFARRRPEAGEGVVVNLLDERVWNLTPHFTTYTLSKAGLWALTQTLALALAPHIRVVGIGPGPALPSARQSAEQFARQASRTPLRRPTSPQEIATTLRFILAMPSLTGQMLALDGGQHLDWAPGGAAGEE